MKKYYLHNKAQSNGDYEVHCEGCNYLPLPENRIFLGDFSFCAHAVSEAKKSHPNSKINGCYYCAKPCHTS